MVRSVVDLKVVRSHDSHSMAVDPYRLDKRLSGSVAACCAFCEDVSGLRTASGVVLSAFSLDTCCALLRFFRF